MTHVYSLGTSGTKIFRFHYDLSTASVVVGSTSDAYGTVIANLHSLIPGAEHIRINRAAMCAVTAVAGADGSTTYLSLFVQKNAGNNVRFGAADCDIAVSGGAVAIGTQASEVGITTQTVEHYTFSGATAKTLNLVLAAKGAATGTSTTGLLEIVVELEYTCSR